MTTPRNALEIRTSRGRMELVAIVASSMLPVRDGDEVILGIQQQHSTFAGWVAFSVQEARLAAFWLSENVPPKYNRRLVLVKISDLVQFTLQKLADNKEEVMPCVVPTDL